MFLIRFSPPYCIQYLKATLIVDWFWVIVFLLCLCVFFVIVFMGLKFVLPVPQQMGPCQHLKHIKLVFSKAASKSLNTFILSTNFSCCK